MDYIVFDMEWNQAGYGRPMIREPLPLEGEIIQIGALKLGPALEPLGEFTVYIRPRVYRKMNHKVQQITHISNEDLANGESFPDAVKAFSEFCGENFCLVTWGSDDMRVLKQNLAFKHCPDEWLPEKRFDLQLVYDRMSGNKNETSLGAALENYGIALDRPQHNALNDAFYTAEVMRRIGLEAVDKLYSAPVVPKRSGELNRVEMRIESSRRKALTGPQLSNVLCPICGEVTTLTGWIEQGGGRYISCASCAADGDFFLRLRFRRSESEELSAVVTTFSLTPEYKELYDSRAEQIKTEAPKRRRSHRRKAQVVPDEALQDN